jgi:hypothetical protein
MMEAARTSETLVHFYQTTRRYNPEDSHLWLMYKLNIPFWLLFMRGMNTRDMKDRRRYRVKYTMGLEEVGPVLEPSSSIFLANLRHDLYNTQNTKPWWYYSKHNHNDRLTDRHKNQGRKQVGPNVISFGEYWLRMRRTVFSFVSALSPYKFASIPTSCRQYLAICSYSLKHKMNGVKAHITATKTWFVI